MIYFVTVNYNSTPLLESLIDSISYGIMSSYEILIVNNSPQDRAIKSLAGDRVKIIESGENIGFGRACNLGIQYVWQKDCHALIWLINPDATIDFGADEYIYQTFNLTKDIAVLGTQIRISENKLWFVSGTFNKWTGLLKHRSILDKNRELDALSISTQWVTGCSLILKLENFNECPKFDCRYFLYSEDADFCIRYSEQGYKIAVTNSALVTHEVSSIIGKNIAFQYESYTFGRLYFLCQHATCLGFYMYLIFILVKMFFLIGINYQEFLGRKRGLFQFVNLMIQETCLFAH